MDDIRVVLESGRIELRPLPFPPDAVPQTTLVNCIDVEPDAVAQRLPSEDPHSKRLFLTRTARTDSFAGLGTILHCPISYERLLETVRATNGQVPHDVE